MKNTFQTHSTKYIIIIKKNYLLFSGILNYMKTLQNLRTKWKFIRLLYNFDNNYMLKILLLQVWIGTKIAVKQ